MLMHIFPTVAIILIVAAFIAGMVMAIVQSTKRSAQAKLDAQERQEDRFRRIDRELSQVDWTEEEEEDKEV